MVWSIAIGVLLEPHVPLSVVCFLEFSSSYLEEVADAHQLVLCGVSLLVSRVDREFSPL